ncbi:hypothetical protein M6G53_17105 [Serratia nevei]|uniref:MrpH family fimbial adhesin n=1 Tax=Serratia nevei TaxID=2703794 RepID=UPI00209E8C36|nr:hypothetical protein [Serratia nevei]MCP1107092.1 hypothetical protein [Serratia nevei]
MNHIFSTIKYVLLAWLLLGVSPAVRAINIGVGQYANFDGTYWYFSGILYDWFGDDPYPNPCYRAGSCELGLQLYISNDVGGSFTLYGNPSWFASGAWVSGAANLGEMGKLLRQNVSLPVQRMLYQGRPRPGGDFSIIYTCLVYRTNGGTQQVFVSGGFCSAGGSGSSGTWCEAKSGDIAFNYGVLASEAVNGQTRTARYALWCNRTVTAKVYARNLSGGRLFLSADRRLYADLTIDGRELGTGVTQVFREGVESSYTIQSKLGSSGELQGGKFAGSTVIYIDIQ